MVPLRYLWTQKIKIEILNIVLYLEKLFAMKKLFAINKNFLLLVSLSSCFALFSQKYTINSTEFPEKLTENANSIIINQNTTIEIKSINDMVITKSFTICVLNELGLKNIDAVEYYDKSTRINSIEAFQFDQYGKEIKKYKRKDFRDQSVADGFSIYTDNRVLYLNFTPIQYPFTIIFNSQVETSNTAFIPTWYPINDWNESVVKSSINIQYPEDLGFKFKAILNDNPSIESNKTSNSISFVATNLTSLKPEDFSPSLTQIAPRVLFGLNNFNIEGIVGQANTWEDFGIWRYKTFLSDNEEVSVETQEKIKALVGFETDPIKKAKIVYQYVQDKTRYVSIQLGIGGWKPMPAIDVDRLGYGDCKALTNYTRVLLNVVNVPSFYTVIYGDSKKINFQEDFVSMQGNHIILSLPINDKLCFLECTSQTVPFGFGGNFTDDRYALIVKPTGGEIIKTNAYVEKDNSQITSGQYTIDEKGSIKGQLTIESKGVRYSNKFGLEKSATDATINFYKSCFDNISNLKIENTAFENNRESVQFLEKIKKTKMITFFFMALFFYNYNF